MTREKWETLQTALPLSFQRYFIRANAGTWHLKQMSNSSTFNNSEKIGDHERTENDFSWLSPGIQIAKVRLSSAKLAPHTCIWLRLTISSHMRYTITFFYATFSFQLSLNFYKFLYHLEFWGRRVLRTAGSGRTVGPSSLLCTAVPRTVDQHKTDKWQ